jgi:hypothetical protein
LLISVRVYEKPFLVLRIGGVVLKYCIVLGISVSTSKYREEYWIPRYGFIPPFLLLFIVLYGQVISCNDYFASAEFSTHYLYHSCRATSKRVFTYIKRWVRIRLRPNAAAYGGLGSLITVALHCIVKIIPTQYKV